MSTRRDFLHAGLVSAGAALVIPRAEWVRKFFPVGIDLRGTTKVMAPTAMEYGTGRAIYTVDSALAFHRAFSAARAGDIIELAVGTAVTNNLYFPASKPITIRSVGWT